MSFNRPPVSYLRQRLTGGVVWRCVVGVCLLLSLGVVGVCGVGAQQVVSPSELVSDMLARQAMRALAEGADAATRQPHADQRVRAETLLGFALELTPDDAALWALRAELAQQVGDESTRQEALRRYAELRPDEDAIRLELILSELAGVETLDGRLTLLEQRLEELRPPAMTEPLRSRLSSAAAALALELGDDSAYLRHLKTAVTSDSANAEAAAMTYELAVRRDAPARSLAAAAINVVRARPVDSDTRLLLARRLADVGVYDRAVEQFEVALQLPRDEAVDPADLAVWSRCLIATGRSAAAADLLDQIETYYRQQGGDGGPGQPMPLELLLHRRALQGDTEAGRATMQRLRSSLQPGIDAGDPDAILNAAWVEAVFGGDTQEVSELLQGQEQSDPRYRRASGFVFLREGSDDWARSTFEAIAQDDDVAAYGLALLQGRDEAGRARFLRDVNQQHPGSFGSLLASRQLQEMGRDVLPGAEGSAVVASMNRLPSTLWRLEMSRNPWVMVRTRFENARSEFLQPIVAELSVSNALDIPLPMDPESGVDGTVLASIAAYSGGRLVGQMPPALLSLPRRLTLAPRERLAGEARLDRSLFGLFLVRNAPGTLNYNVSFAFSPRFLAEGGVTTGPLGGLDTVRSLQAVVPAYGEENLRQWSTQATEGSGAGQMFALAMLTRAGENLARDGVDRGVSRSAIAAVNTAFEAGDPLLRSWILQLLPAQTRARSEFQPLLDLARRSDDPLVSISLLLSQATEASHADLATAIRDGGPRVKRFAQALSEGLKREAQQPKP